MPVNGELLPTVKEEERLIVPPLRCTVPSVAAMPGSEAPPPVKVTVPVPAFVNVVPPAMGEEIDAVTPPARVSVGVVPLKVNVPPEIVYPEVFKVISLTVPPPPVINTVPGVAAKTASLSVPEAGQMVPAPFQLAEVVSQSSEPPFQL